MLEENVCSLLWPSVKVPTNPFVGGRGGNIITGTVELNEVTVHQH